MTIEKKSSFYLLLLILLITTAVSWPGLDSGFYLDDYPNLSPLESIDNDGFLSYILGGVSSLIGRPLSLLTFAFQYEAWPGNAFAFKLVNLVIHLLNGCLVFFICRLLGSQILPSSGRRRAMYFSLIVTAMWLLHPIQQNTVFYTVQRMTELSAFFSLAGFIIYLTYRQQIITARSTKVIIWKGILIWLFMLAAILCKENGILLPLLILITEWTLFASSDRSRVWKTWSTIFLVLPLVVLAIYLVAGLEAEIQSYRIRDYTVIERLLTQSGVLYEYLQNILLPRLSAFSLFNDDYPVSRGLFSPPMVFVSLVIILLLSGAAIVKRKAWPVLSFGILWFMSGHILEASHLNLELYFDHRNYLPSLGIFFLISYAFFILYEKYRAAVLVAGIGYLALIVVTAVGGSKLWAHPGDQLRLAVSDHPRSVRAQTYLLNHYIKTRQIDRAEDRLQVIAGMYPDEMYPYLKQLSISACIKKQDIHSENWKRVYDQSDIARNYGFDSVSALNNMAFLANSGYCNNLDKTALVKLIDQLVENNEFGYWRSNLYEIAASLHAGIGHEQEMVNYILKAGKYSHSVPHKIAHINLLLSIDRPDEARKLFSILKKYLAKHNRQALAWNRQLDRIEKEIKQDNK